MAKQIAVIYEDGVFRPLESVELPEHQRGMVMIEEPTDDTALLDHAFIDSCAPTGPRQVSIEAVRKVLTKIPGSLTPDFRAERDRR